MPGIMELQGQCLLAPLTTLGLGGRAEYFIDISTLEELRDLYQEAQKRSLSLTILGGGSNALIPDDGVEGIVFRYGGSHLQCIEAQSDAVIVDVGAGYEWDALVAWAVNEGLWGLECLSGIPGWVGAAPIQNIGAYGVELADVLRSIEVFDMSDGSVQRLECQELGLGYRDSHLKRHWRGRFVVLSIRLELSRNGVPNLSYRDLQVLNESPRTPTLLEIRERVLNVRAQKSMLARVDDPDAQSLGSFFVNPVLGQQELESVKKICSQRNLGPLPFHAFGDSWKVPAAWLIEKAGFARGTVFGGVGISRKHSLALINRGDGSTAELLALAERIKDTCREIFGVELEREPQPLTRLELS